MRNLINVCGQWVIKFLKLSGLSQETISHFCFLIKVVRAYISAVVGSNRLVPDLKLNILSDLPVG